MEAVGDLANLATIIEFLSPKIQSLNEYITSPDLTKDLGILEETMSSIPDLMLVAESRYDHASGVRHFVPRLRELAYDAEDLLDELSYDKLKQQVLDQASTSIADGKKRKITWGWASPSKVLSFLKKGWARASTSKAERIQNLIEELNRVIHGLKDAFALAEKLKPSVPLTHSNTTTTVTPSHRVTTSNIDLKRVCGREAEKKQMMDFLTRDPPIHDKKVFIFAITGIGGVGKTTLAQYAFNNVKDRFDLKVWICVSNAFDRKRLLQEIIEGITGASPSQHEEIGVDTLECTIKREVKDKTLLLVLDDVWSTDWMDLLPSLQSSEAKCCKVIVTTREVKNITQTHHYESKMLPLVGLQGEEYRTLFEEQAFGDEDPTEHLELRRIGEEIARKLKGNPLAVKTVGAVLREKLEIQHWNGVVENNLWNLEKEPDDIMPALMLSYLHLPFHLRRCFSYCALFPQDYQFDPERLVWMWIAQGFVVCTNRNERLEDVGSKIFRELVSRSFFAEYFTYSNTPNYTDSESMGMQSIYTVHDLLHDLATLVSNEKALSCHHLSANMLDPHRLPADLHRIRTLICSDEYSKMLVPIKVSKSLKSVRVLGRIRMVLFDDLNDLGRLIHLRYLDLSLIDDFEIYEPLLKSICCLYHLQTLLLNHDYDKEYPNAMSNLINLRHLRGNRNSIARIECIGKLVQLQELEMFEVGNGSLHNIRQLKEINQLHGELTISNICQVEAVDDAKNANIQMKKYLRSLSLQWCNDERTCSFVDSNVQHYDNVLEYLKPHNYLERLEISNHKGSKPPSWLSAPSLQYIKHIHLCHCNKWRHIPHLAQLLYLEKLTITDMDLVVDLADQKVAFPFLKEIELENMSIVCEFISIEEGPPSCQVFPKLRKMRLDMYKNLVSIKKLNDLSDLTELVICDSEFTSFNAAVMDSLKALETLELKDCICLKSLPDPPSTLKELRIRGSYHKDLEADLQRSRLTSYPKIVIFGE